MTDAETAAHIRKNIDDQRGHYFGWITDGCGYAQHMRFVTHRNDHWEGGSYAEWRAFVLAYADMLERGST